MILFPYSLLFYSCFLLLVISSQETVLSKNLFIPSGLLYSLTYIYLFLTVSYNSLYFYSFSFNGSFSISDFESTLLFNLAKDLFDFISSKNQISFDDLFFLISSFYFIYCYFDFYYFLSSHFGLGLFLFYFFEMQLFFLS